MVMNENAETVYGIIVKSLDSKFTGEGFWNDPKHVMKRKTILTVLKAYLDMSFSEEESSGGIPQILFKKFIESDHKQREEASLWLYKKACRAVWVMLGDGVVEESIDGMMIIDNMLRREQNDEK